MKARNVLLIVRGGLAGAIIAAIAVQCYYSMRFLHGSPVNYFSFFTIQTNLIAVAALLAYDSGMLRGAATLYIIIVGIVFKLLLAGVEGAESIPWVNTVVHNVSPIVMAVLWLVDPARVRKNYARTVATWLVYPLAYLAYSLLRGAAVGWYPYPFLDPRRGGYESVAIVCAAIFAFAIALGLLVAAYSRRRLRALAT